MRKKYKFLIIVGFLAAIFAFNQLGLAGFFQNNFSKITAPFSKLLWRVGDSVSDVLVIPFKLKQLKEENKSLTEQNIILKQKIAQLAPLLQENETLRTAFKFAQEKKIDLMMADVLSYDESLGTITVSKGRQEGLSEGMTVVTKEGAVAGRVEKVFDDFSSVVLITSLKSSFEIEIEIESQEIILAAAMGQGQTIKFNLAPQNSLINPGSLARTTALGGTFPKGILVGEVKNVKNNQTDSFQEGEITPYFDIETLGILFVIL